MLEFKKISFSELIEGQKYNVPNSGDSIDVINNKLRKLNENLLEHKFCISFRDYKDLVQKIREIAKNSEYCRVYHSFSDIDMKFYGVNESEEKLNDLNFDCDVTQFMIEVKRN